MTRFQQWLATAVAGVVVSVGAAVAQTPEQAKGADQPLIAMIGCIERVMPPPPPPGTPPASAPAAPPAYKIMDVQPGSSIRQKPKSRNSRPVTAYWMPITLWSVEKTYLRQKPSAS